MNVLVTGGAGYIGSHVAWALAQAGHKPVVLDSLVTGHRWAAVKSGPFVEGDMGDVACVRALCEAYRPEAIMHFAAFIEVAESVAKPEKYKINNYEKARRLFETAVSCGVRQIVFSSTAAVYGAPQSEEPLSEVHPLAPINPYGAAKLLTEDFLRSLKAQGVRSTILRYFNAAGAGPSESGLGEAHAPETHLIPNVLLAGLGLKDKLSIFGTDYPTRDGTAVRDYVHVMDLAEAHLAALVRMKADGGSEVFNLGTGSGSTILEVLQAARRALGHDVPHTFGPRRAGDPPVLVADATRAKQILKWEPQRTLDDIVTSALAWHQTPRYRETVEAAAAKV